jgi:3-isopropylmalate/(R)-2-methylmalate dehydratase small subunit
MVSPAKTGYGERLFAAARYRSSNTSGPREENPDFVLNQAPFRHARILIAGENFGCGSSREHAVWAIRQFGFRCVVAPSFGTIFRNNCVGNGVLPVVLSRDMIDVLAVQAGQGDFTIDLDARTVKAPDGQTFAFEIDEVERDRLLRGLDAISMTKLHAADFAAFESRDRLARPWMWRG